MESYHTTELIWLFWLLSDAIVGISQFERLGVCGGGGPGQQHSPEDQETVRGRPLRPGLLSDPGKFPGLAISPNISDLGWFCDVNRKSDEEEFY